MKTTGETKHVGWVSSTAASAWLRFLTDTSIVSGGKFKLTLVSSLLTGAKQMALAKPRNGALDVYRYLTVTFAIVSHIILHHNIYGDELVGGLAFAKAITRSATPTLLILFGMMVEMVYARRFREDRPATAGSLLYRAILCYLAFIILALAEFLLENGNASRLIAAVPLISPVENGNIFKLYAILLVLTYPILMLRSRFGVPGLLAMVAVLWALYYLVIDRFPALPFPLHHIGGVLFGIGDEWGPSILHSSLLVVFGMLMSNVLTGEKRLRFATPAFAGIIALSFGYLAWAVFQYGLDGVALRIADIDAWRRTNDFGYYAFGIMASVVILSVSYALDWALPKRVSEPMRLVGGVTLMYFFTANIILSAVPEFEPTLQWHEFSLVLGYILFFSLLAYVWARWGRRTNWVAGINSNGPVFIASAFRRQAQPKIRSA